MMKFHRKVNPKEGLVGMYITSNKLGEHESILIKYFSDQFASDKKKALLPQPLIMMVDPSLQENKLSIKVRIMIWLMIDKDIERSFQFLEEFPCILWGLIQIRTWKLPKNWSRRSILRPRTQRHTCYLFHEWGYDNWKDIRLDDYLKATQKQRPHDKEPKQSHPKSKGVWRLHLASHCMSYTHKIL